MNMLSAQDVASLLNIHYKTVYRWIKEGKWRAVKLQNSNRSPYRIPISEVEARTGCKVVKDENGKYKLTFPD